MVNATGGVEHLPGPAAPIADGFKVPPSGRERRLVDLAEAVAAGRYRPDPGRIAAAMIQAATRPPKNLPRKG